MIEGMFSENGETSPSNHYSVAGSWWFESVFCQELNKLLTRLKRWTVLPVSSDDWWNSKTRNPWRVKCLQTNHSCNWGQRNNLRSPGGPVNHGEDICKSLTVRERSNQIQMNRKKTSARNRNFLHSGMNMFLNFIFLAGKTCFSPWCYLCW